MVSINKNTGPLENFTDKQIEELDNSIKMLEQEDIRINEAEAEEEQRVKSTKKPFQRLRKSPFEIINRSFFILFLISFLFSFISIYAINSLWFFLYVVSAFSCIIYTPNRKALKELIDAWPNVNDLIKGRRK